MEITKVEDRMYLYYNLDCLRVDCSTVFITFGLVFVSTKGGRFLASKLCHVKLDSVLVTWQSHELTRRGGSYDDME